MALYSRRRGRRIRQLTADLLALGWLVGWAVVAAQVWQWLMQVAEPARQLAAAATRMRDDFIAAGRDASGVPVVGEQLRQPFESAAGSLGPMIDAALAQVRTLEQVAVVAGVLVFLLPAALVLVTWLPLRVRFVRRSRDLQALLDSGADLDLLALRALATQPMRALAVIDPDPLGRWRAGQWDTILALADLELADAGAGVPERLRQDPPARLASIAADHRPQQGS